MRALVWNGIFDVRVETVPDPILLNPHDIIVQVTSTAICGSDLHLYDGVVPAMEPGDILGHEFMGSVVQVGKEVKKVKIHDRVLVPFTIACGQCEPCKQGLTAQCDNSNPNAWMAEAMLGFSPGGYYGYTHLFGGYAGGQAEYVRVPFADFCAFPVPESLTDEQVLFLTDIFPTGYQAAENGNIKPGDVVAVWGDGPVGQFAIKSAYLLGAEKVIAIDSIPERLRLAREASGAVELNYSGRDVVEILKDMTGGRGPDVCIDAVGFESQGHSAGAIFDKIAFALKLETDKAHVQRQAIQACRKGGTISTPGVYLDVADFYPIGVAFGKDLQMRMGQTNMHKYILPLMDKIQKGEIDPGFVITHRMPLSEAAKGYEIFKYRKDGCIKVVLKP